jgi:hypothetical protein
MYLTQTLHAAGVEVKHRSVQEVLIDETGSHDFSHSKFVRLEIARNGADGGYYLFHICADGNGTDTWHATINEALEEADSPSASNWLIGKISPKC